MVGFRLGSYEEGNFDIVSAMSCHHISDRTKELVEVWVYGVGGAMGVVIFSFIQMFESYLNQSELPPYSSKTEEGCVCVCVRVCVPLVLCHSDVAVR